jgi:spectinomycin phosphotransferase
MRERPPLPDAALVAALADGWGVAAATIEFLPVGDDSRAWSFRVVTGDGAPWFLKVRRGRADPAAVLVPRFLRDHGLEPVVAAVPLTGGSGGLKPSHPEDGGLWRSLDGYTLLVYPWVEGVVPIERGLTDRQWADLGRFVAALHRTELPPGLAATVAVEWFVPWGAAPVRALDARIGQVRDGDPPRRELAGFWRDRRDEIAVAADRAMRLGRAVAAARPELVLCHADLHLANLLVGPEDRLRVVDWDGLQLAPRERDLLFVAGPERARFLDGYGPVTLDRRLAAYYRWSGWCRSWPTTAVASSTTGSATTRGGTPWRSSGGCSRPGTWSRRPGWPTGA